MATDEVYWVIYLKTPVRLYVAEDEMPEALKPDADQIWQKDRTVSLTDMVGTRCVFPMDAVCLVFLSTPSSRKLEDEMEQANRKQEWEA